ncbi:MAG: DNA repair protein RecO [Gammaproteobacteria bacterium]
MKVDLEPAYVLHTRAYRETSLIVELLTAHQGRKGVVAKGARRAKSPLKALLQPCRPILVSWSGRGDLGSLTGAEAAGPAPVLAGRALWSALYVNELLERLVRRDEPQEGLFQVYVQTLAVLAEADDPEPTLRLFERDLLEVCGYGLILDHAVDSGAAIEADARYYYRPDQGPGAEDDGESLPVTGATLLALDRGELGSAEIRREAKRLMRTALAPHLGDRPLKSRELFQ